jgi:hypothetical protein
MQVRNSFFNEPVKMTENTLDKTVKKTPNKIEIKDTIHPDSNLEKYDLEDTQHVSKNTFEELLKSEYKPYTGNNEVNALNNRGLSFYINHYLTQAVKILNMRYVKK